MVQDGEQKIARPRQVYLGSAKRDYLPPAERATSPAA
jgi:citrate synthase